MGFHVGDLGKNPQRSLKKKSSNVVYVEKVTPKVWGFKVI